MTVVHDEILNVKIRVGPTTPDWPAVNGPVVSVTGHRPKRVGEAKGWVCDELARVMDKLAPARAVTGMADGTDLWWADAARAQHRRVAAIAPFPEQAARWSRAARSHWHQTWAAASDRWYSRVAYQHDAYWVRNQQLVAVADIVVAVYDGEAGGGTAHAVGLAHKAGLELIVIDPAQRTVTRRRVQ